ncbi:hypothetical protein TWF694_001066 [Orbilia ellipsospora]|uniref:Rhamnogalacturonase A/B/Epimerase-like pectate lyase domain-containing protein n=1 Tax=Orbilia ellipsospora TaxID=2528407 RepID=A0AAV9XRC4_9PEZI
MPTTADTTHIGIFMENGSGGFMSDVVFNGGAIGAIFGNQQFTARNFQFNNCRTAAVQFIWDWAFTIKSFTINNCGIGFNALGGAGGTGAGGGQGTGSITIIDSTITNTQTAVLTSISGANATSILLENVQFSSVGAGVVNSGSTLLAGGTRTVNTWASGNFYDSGNTNGERLSQAQGEIPISWTRPSALLGANGWFQRSKPQYESLSSSGFLNAKTLGAKGDGQTDDTVALNNAFITAANSNSVLWIPHGIYIISDTVVIPPGSRVVGEIWPQLMASGANFADQSNPRPLIRVGNTGFTGTGTVELQDLIFTVKGGMAGAILMEWNIIESAQGTAGLWDCHFRVGGAYGSNLQASQCPKKTGAIRSECIGELRNFESNSILSEMYGSNGSEIAASLLLHIKGSGYFENVWLWTADHDLDLLSQDQIDVYAGRGVLIESSGPVWLYGTASEHNVLYQYQIQDSSNVFLGMIQTESPYFQGAPIGAPAPFGPTEGDTKKRDLWKRANEFQKGDPGFGTCGSDPECTVSWAIRIVRSQDISVYGAGLYSWFQNYDQTCLSVDHCQTYLGSVEDHSTRIAFYNLVGIGARIMMAIPAGIAAYAQDNQNGFASTVLGFFVTSPTSSASTLGTLGSITGVWGISRGVTMSLEGDGKGDGTLVGGIGDALVIVSTSRYILNRAGAANPLLVSRAYEYWVMSDAAPGCDLLEGGPNINLVGVDTATSLDQVLAMGQTDQPVDDVPNESTLLEVNNIGCQFHKDILATDWDHAVTGESVGYLKCDTTIIPCTKPLQPWPSGTSGRYTCVNTLYLLTAICYLPINAYELAPRISGGGGGIIGPIGGPGAGGRLPGVPWLDIYLTRAELDAHPDFFARTIRRQDFYRPNVMLFYCRRINATRLTPGLSNPAQLFAASRGLQTIWDGWFSVFVDGIEYVFFDFYDVSNDFNFLTTIRQTIFTPGLEDDANQLFYFSGMSAEYARRAVGIVYVLTEDPLRIPEEGIFYVTEWPILTRRGTTVTQIIATDERGTVWFLIWSVSDTTVSRTSPRQIPPPTFSPPAKKRQIESQRKRADGLEPNYGSECLYNDYALDDHDCIPNPQVLSSYKYERTPVGWADFFG